MNDNEEKQSKIKERSKRWCFTQNNPKSNELFANPLPGGIRFVIWSRERGTEQGTEHLQGYISFKYAKRLGEVKAVIGNNPHVERARGNEQQNIDYCSKSETHLAGPWELGKREAPGRRTDLENIGSEVRRTGLLSGLDNKSIIRYGKGLQLLASFAPPPWRRNLRVICIVGPTGIGKTYQLFTRFGSEGQLYRPCYGNNGIWWNGYNGQKTVCIDEFNGQCPMEKMLQILDQYPLLLETKGSFVPAHYELCFITSNREPQDWYTARTNNSTSTNSKPGTIPFPTIGFARQFDALRRRVGCGTPNYIYISDSHGEDNETLRKELSDKLDALNIVQPRVESSESSSVGNAPGSDGVCGQTSESEHETNENVDGGYQGGGEHGVLLQQDPRPQCDQSLSQRFGDDSPRNIDRFIGPCSTNYPSPSQKEQSTESATTQGCYKLNDETGQFEWLEDDLPPQKKRLLRNPFIDDMAVCSDSDNNNSDD